MNDILLLVLITIVLLALMIPALLFFRKNTDMQLDGDMLILRYPLSKETIRLSTDLKRWNLQEAYFLRLGKIYAIHLELENGKQKSISSRFNAEDFQKVLRYLNGNYSARREASTKG